MRIDRIEPSRHKKGRVLIFLETGACLKVTEQELLDFSIHAGEELDPDTLQRLREAAGVSNLKAKAVELISKSAMSRRELERKLRDRGAAPEEAESIADWLASMGLLNDREYALSLARRCAEKGYGPARVRSKLYEKGVPRDLWEEAMADLPDEAAQIDAYLARKLRGRLLTGGNGEEKERRKLTASLLRRGFAWEDIRSAWERYEQDVEE